MRLILKTCASLAILLFAASVSVAQNAAPSRNDARLQPQCTHKFADFPALLGLKLTMSSADLSKIYPKVYVQDKFGLNQYIVVSERYIKDEGLKQNVETIGATILNDKLVEFAVDYEPLKEWDSIAAFAKSHAESLNIPINFWKFHTALGNDFGKVRCADFFVEVAVFHKPPHRQRLMIGVTGDFFKVIKD